MNDHTRQFRDQIADAAARGASLRIRGGGSKDWYGQALQGELLDTRAHSGILAYEPSELVMTARTGTPLAEIEAALAMHGQMLAFEPPHFGPHATLGGAIAAALCGPRRASSGALRDFVLGVVMMDGQGQVLRFGGSVMKNVAGYDVARLLAGSLGTLGLMLAHSVKVLPCPPAEITLRFELEQAAALGCMHAWASRPLPVSGTCWRDGVLTVRLSGARAAVDAARTMLGGELAPDGPAFWRALREQRLAWFAGEAPLWRLSLPSTTPVFGASGPQLIEWAGAQRWLRADMAQGPALRAMACAAGGHATLFRGGDKTAGVFQPLAPAMAQLQARLKTSFDPSNLFNPGRMY